MVSQPALSFLLSQTNGELQKKQHGESSAEPAESKALRKESLGCLKTLNPRGAGPGRREWLQHGELLCNAGLGQHLP